MPSRNPHALYINCDGAMDYDKEKSGGVGFVVSFPENMHREDITVSKGRYIGGNIERIEYEALIQAMKYVLALSEKENLSNISQVIFISDRFALNDSERTNPYKIREWRRNRWKNHEGKPIKNHDLLDELDKLRKKLNDQTRMRVNIEYRPRKFNKIADKLAKAAKKEGLTNDRLSKKGEKIGKRLFEGGEIRYSKLSVRDKIEIHVFRKDPVQELWEVWCEICSGPNLGDKLKIYSDNELSRNLQRLNKYIVCVKAVYSHHITIYKTVKKIKKAATAPSPEN